MVEQPCVSTPHGEQFLDERDVEGLSVVDVALVVLVVVQRNGVLNRVLAEAQAQFRESTNQLFSINGSKGEFRKFKEI